MDQKQALAALRAAIPHKKWAGRDSRVAGSPEEREAARIERAAVKAKIAEAEAAIRPLRLRVQELDNIIHRYRYAVGQPQGVGVVNFYMIEGQGDTWDEAVAQAIARRDADRARCAAKT